MQESKQTNKVRKEENKQAKLALEKKIDKQTKKLDKKETNKRKSSAGMIQTNEQS